MKSQFSTSWVSSVQPRKQRKYVHNAPLHIKHKFLSAHLSKDLRSKYGKRNLPLRKGDEVLIMQGPSKKKKAKVVSVEVNNSRVALEGIQRTKKDGSKVSIYFNPRALRIITLELGDKLRLNALERKNKVAKTANPKEVKTDTKPKEKKNASN